MKTQLTQSEIISLDLLINWSILVNGSEKTIQMIESNKIAEMMEAFNNAYYAFFDKVVKEKSAICAQLNKSVYLAILTRDFKKALHS